MFLPLYRLHTFFHQGVNGKNFGIVADATSVRDVVIYQHYWKQLCDGVVFNKENEMRTGLLLQENI